MKKKGSASFTGVVAFVIAGVALSYSQTVTVSAGSNQLLDWEQTHVARLKGSVLPAGTKVEWSCPQNKDVVFKSAFSPVTEVTFPRPGYYLLVLSPTKVGNGSLRSTVVVNVCKVHSYKERLADLIGLMTVDEKVCELTNEADSIPRLGIPRYNYWSEALHGVVAGGATSFPQGIAMGATWDPDLVYKVASAISDEARVLSVTEGKGLTYWSPTINVARDPRWGRNEESYSEDPYLLSRMGVEFVKGMQGDDPYYLKTVSTPKHFMANNEEERRHTGSSDLDMRTMYEYYLPAFHQAIVEGKAYSIMGAYNEVNHVPCNANTFLLTDLLRRAWGFDGFVVSDCGAVSDMLDGHHFFKTGAEAAARSVLAGCDLDCGVEYRQYLKEALTQGLLEEKDLDRALERVLSARFRLGEFDPPEMVPYKAIPKEKLDSRENRDLALEAARKSIVLLKNDGILPLSGERAKSVAIIGPLAAEMQPGIYSGWPNVHTTSLEGILNQAAAHGMKAEYAKGCVVTSGLLGPIAPRYFSKVKGTGQSGAKAEFFDNMQLSGTPVFTRIDSCIDFNFGTLSPAPGMPKEHYSIRWKGTIIPPDTIRRIGTSTDDGVRLYLDGKLVIDDWHDHGETPNSAEVTLLPGKEYQIEFDQYNGTLGSCARLTWDLAQRDFNEAKRIAARNDIVVLVVGTSPEISREELDRTEIELPRIQRELIQEVASVNPRIVIVLVNGGPVALAGTERHAEAIVEGWFGGEYAGKAIGEVLFGETNPGGRLPETFYASTTQLPPMYDYDIINRPRTYMYFGKPVLFPFGYGLSYTRFEYANLTLSAERIKSNGDVVIQFTVQNAGSMKGDEVTQVYVHSSDASFNVPINQLKRFERITLAPGETKTLEFSIPASELSFYDMKTNVLRTLPGKWEISVGSSSQDLRLKKTLVIE